jgi:hypothetical protein
MDDVTIMHELNCMANLFDDLSNFLFLKSALVFQLAVDIPSEAEF